MFVQRITGLAVVAEGVELARSESATGFVQWAGFVAEPEVLIVFVARLPVVDLSAALLRCVGVGWAVFAAGEPVRAGPLFPDETKGFERDYGTEFSARQRYRFRAVRYNSV